MDTNKLKSAINKSIAGHSYNQAYVNEMAALFRAYVNCLNYVRSYSKLVNKSKNMIVDVETYKKFIGDMQESMQLGAFHTTAYVIFVCTVANLSYCGKDSDSHKEMIEQVSRLALNNGYTYENICMSMGLMNNNKNLDSRENKRQQGASRGSVAGKDYEIDKDGRFYDLRNYNLNQRLNAHKQAQDYESGCGQAPIRRFTSGCGSEQMNNYTSGCGGQINNYTSGC